MVSIHQPHVRPIVRGKASRGTEFGAKISVSLIDGDAHLDRLSWDAYNEGGVLMTNLALYRERYGYFPESVAVDKIYTTKMNRACLKELGIRLIGKPLGRPAAGYKNKDGGIRNPIEGKFGQVKLAYGMNRIQARLRLTSESWIAAILFVMNLVRLAKSSLLYILFVFRATFSVLRNYEPVVALIELKQKSHYPRKKLKCV